MAQDRLRLVRKHLPTHLAGPIAISSRHALIWELSTATSSPKLSASTGPKSALHRRRTPTPDTPNPRATGDRARPCKGTFNGTYRARYRFPNNLNARCSARSSARSRISCSFCSAVFLGFGWSSPRALRASRSANLRALRAFLSSRPGRTSGAGGGGGTFPEASSPGTYSPNSQSNNFFPKRSSSTLVECSITPSGPHSSQQAAVCSSRRFRRFNIRRSAGELMCTFP